MQFAANITLLDFGCPVLERPSRAKALGFDGIECLFPYDHSLEEWDTALSGLPVALINSPEPDWAAGARGCGALVGWEETFRERVEKAQTYAKALGVDRLHLLSGNATGEDAQAVLVRNLQWAADSAPDLIHTIEPLNPIDMPGYFLNDYHLAIDILAQVDRPNVGLQYDAWHAKRIHGAAQDVWNDCKTYVTHVQIAGLAARNAPDLTNADEVALLEAIADHGYDGWISAEYMPAPADDPDWLAKARQITG